MKFRLAVKLMELILGTAVSDDEPRADMFLPVKVLSLAPVMLIAGVVFAVIAAINGTTALAVLAPICIILGVAALLCWRNQKIVMLSDDEFEYSTFLGKKTVYRFDEIKMLRRNKDSMTLYVGEGKVHMESSAIFTERLLERINRQLAKNAANE